jgi:hypothetical protein
MHVSQSFYFIEPNGNVPPFDSWSAQFRRQFRFYRTDELRCYI